MAAPAITQDPIKQALETTYGTGYSRGLADATDLFWIHLSHLPANDRMALLQRIATMRVEVATGKVTA